MRRLVASCHWGLHQDVLEYMPEIAPIDAGADVVFGRPRTRCRSRYAKASRFTTASAAFLSIRAMAAKHGDWVGMLRG
jgi:hypothetical protein